jgi:hypothetical protein
MSHDTAFESKNHANQGVSGQKIAASFSFIQLNLKTRLTFAGFFETGTERRDGYSRACPLLLLPYQRGCQTSKDLPYRPKENMSQTRTSPLAPQEASEH